MTPAGGEPTALLVLLVDDEGFSYHLIGPDAVPDQMHWWPFDEVTSVEPVDG